MNNYYVYILSNWNNKVIYVGVTNNLERRIYEHQNKLVKGFSQKYNLSKLVYFEITNNISSAIIREKEIKKWRREKKNILIETINPNWNDLINDENKISQSNDENVLIRNDKYKITGLIIAAGLSSRMRQFKPLLMWNDKTFISNIIENLNMVCDDIIIITGHESESLQKIVHESYSKNNNRIQCIYNSIYEQGMFTSLKKGIEASKNSNWVLYHQVDQPNLPSLFYTNFVNEIDENYDWIQPRFANKNGHPILLGKKMIKKILETDYKSNLRLLSKDQDIEKKYWDCEHQEIFTDVDTKEDFNNLNGLS